MECAILITFLHERLVNLKESRKESLALNNNFSCEHYDLKFFSFWKCPKSEGTGKKFETNQLPERKVNLFSFRLDPK